MLSYNTWIAWDCSGASYNLVIQCKSELAQKKNPSSAVWEDFNQQPVKPVIGSCSPTLINFISVTIKGDLKPPMGTCFCCFRGFSTSQQQHSGTKTNYLKRKVFIQKPISVRKIKNTWNVCLKRKNVHGKLKFCGRKHMRQKVNILLYYNLLNQNYGIKSQH